MEKWTVSQSFAFNQGSAGVGCNGGYGSLFYKAAFPRDHFASAWYSALIGTFPAMGAWGNNVIQGLEFWVQPNEKSKDGRKWSSVILNQKTKPQDAMKTPFGKDNAVGCKASLKWTFQVCPGCCCFKPGSNKEQSSSAESELFFEMVQTPASKAGKCSLWFVKLDSLFRAYVALLRAMILAKKTACCHRLNDSEAKAKGIKKAWLDHARDDECAPKDDPVGSALKCPASKEICIWDPKKTQGLRWAFYCGNPINHWIFDPCDGGITSDGVYTVVTNPKGRHGYHNYAEMAKKYPDKFSLDDFAHNENPAGVWKTCGKAKDPKCCLLRAFTWIPDMTEAANMVMAIGGNVFGGLSRLHPQGQVGAACKSRYAVKPKEVKKPKGKGGLKANSNPKYEDKSKEYISTGDSANSLDYSCKDHAIITGPMSTIGIQGFPCAADNGRSCQYKGGAIKPNVVLPRLTLGKIFCNEETTKRKDFFKDARDTFAAMGAYYFPPNIKVAHTPTGVQLKIGCGGQKKKLDSVVTYKPPCGRHVWKDPGTITKVDQTGHSDTCCPPEGILRLSEPEADNTAAQKMGKGKRQKEVKNLLQTAMSAGKDVKMCYRGLFGETKSCSSTFHVQFLVCKGCDCDCTIQKNGKKMCDLVKVKTTHVLDHVDGTLTGFTPGCTPWFNLVDSAIRGLIGSKRILANNEKLSTCVV